MNHHAPPPKPQASSLDLRTLPPRLQTMVTILLTHQEHICHYQQGTLIIQFEKERTTAKLTNTLPL
jgi:hypothetical protein